MRRRLIVSCLAGTALTFGIPLTLACLRPLPVYAPQMAFEEGDFEYEVVEALGRTRLDWRNWSVTRCYGDFPPQVGTPRYTLPGWFSPAEEQVTHEAGGRQIAGGVMAYGLPLRCMSWRWMRPRGSPRTVFGVARVRWLDDATDEDRWVFPARVHWANTAANGAAWTAAAFGTLTVASGVSAARRSMRRRRGRCGQCGYPR